MNEQHAADTKAKGAANGQPMIEAIGLSKFYGIFAACRDISFHGQSGGDGRLPGPQRRRQEHDDEAAHRLSGPLGRDRPSIAGHDMATDRIAGSARLGYLPENGPLYPDMTPHSLLEFFADARGMASAKKAERIEAVVDLCVLGSVIHRPISKLSKGFRQRVGMAQALLHEPDVLIMDEPTAGLDPNQIVEVRKTLRRIGEEKDDSALDAHPAGSRGDGQRVIMINEGRLVYDGPSREPGRQARQPGQGVPLADGGDGRGR